MPDEENYLIPIEHDENSDFLFGGEDGENEEDEEDGEYLPLREEEEEEEETETEGESWSEDGEYDPNNNDRIPYQILPDPRP